MINIPIKAFEEVFDKHFVYGSVWFYKNYHFIKTGKTRDKYLIVLNPKADDDNAYFILPTSKVNKFASNSVYRVDCFFISFQQNSCFPEDTMVDVSNIEKKPQAAIRNSYIYNDFDHKIEYRGTLDNDIMAEICRLANDSNRIAPRLLKMVFPPN